MKKHSIILAVVSCFTMSFPSYAAEYTLRLRIGGLVGIVEEAGRVSILVLDEQICRVEPHTAYLSVESSNLEASSPPLTLMKGCVFDCGEFRPAANLEGHEVTISGLPAQALTTLRAGREGAAPCRPSDCNAENSYHDQVVSLEWLPDISDLALRANLADCTANRCKIDPDLIGNVDSGWKDRLAGRLALNSGTVYSSKLQKLDGQIAVLDFSYDSTSVLDRAATETIDVVWAANGPVRFDLRPVRPGGNATIFIVNGSGGSVVDVYLENRPDACTCIPSGGDHFHCYYELLEHVPCKKPSPPAGALNPQCSPGEYSYP